MDKTEIEIKKLIKCSRQKKWLKLMMYLEEIEEKLDTDITDFEYRNGEVIIKLDKYNFVFVNIVE